MDLNVYQVILGPVVSEKAYRLNKLSNKLVLKVHPHANKPMIARALEMLFNIKVEAVRIVVRKGKRRLVKRREVVGSLVKRAIVTLAEGYTLDLLGQAGTGVVASDLNKQPEKGL